jgi:hypothetical protein
LFNFVGGGWNSVWAKTKKGAIKAAEKKYKGEPLLVPDIKSFRLNNDPAAYQVLLNLFY